MKKHISLLLALCMLFTMLPMGMTVVSATTTTVTQSVADPATETDVIEISTLQSEITLTFTPAVADASAVTFTKADGSAVKGAVVGTAGVVEGGSTYTLEFGRLEDNAQYTLTVPTSVTGNGEAAVFTYKASEPGYEINTDMSDISTDEETGALNDARFTYGEGAANYTIQTDGDNKYMQINPSQVYTSNASMYLQIPKAANFNSYLKDIRDVYVVETGVKSWSKTGTENALTNSSKNVLSLATAPFGWGMNAKIKTTNMLNTADAGVNIEPDEAGWSHIKAVVREDGRRGAYNTTVTVGGATEIAFIDVYDNTPGSEKYLGAGKANTWSVNKTAFNVAGFFLAANVDGTNHNVAVDYVRAKKDQAMKVLKAETDYTKQSRQLAFYMSDDINASSLDTITVADASGVAVEGVDASVDAANRAIVVGFPGGIATAGAYTVDLSRVLGTNGVAVWNDEYVVEDNAYVQYTHAVVPFTVADEEAGEIAAIASSTPAADAADVSVHVGTASVSYEVALDDETLDGITLVSVKDGAEAPIRGKVTKTLSDDGKTVTFTFGRLDAGLHRIKVDGTVLNTAAGEIVASETIEFTTTEEGYEINTDMSDISTDAETGALNDARFTYGEGAANYTIQTDGDNKYMQINPSQVYTSNASMYLQIPKAANFNNYLTDIRDVYVVETGVKSWSKTGTETALTNSSKTVISLATAPFGWGMNAKIKTTNMLNTADAGVNIEPDEAGWSHIKAVVREDGRRGAYNTTVTVGGATEIAFIDVYDNTPGSEKYLGAGKANTWSVNKTAFNVAGFFLAANVDGTNHNVAVDYVRAKKERQMTILDSDLAYTKDNRQVVFYMTDDVNAASLDTITVTDAEGTAVEGVSATADAATRAITVSFNEGLAAGTYNVDLSRVLGTNGVAVWNDEYVVEDGAYVQYTHAVVPFTVSSEQSGSYAAIASSTPAAGAEDVSVHVGTASVTYDVALDDETLDGITLVSVKDGAEAPIRGKVTKTLSDDGKTVNFTFGRLDAGLHRIKVDGTVLNTAAGEIVASEIIEFTTTEPGYEVNTDMSDIPYDETTLVVTDAEGDPFTYGVDKKHYTVQTDGDNKYMQINPTEVITSNASMYLQIPKAANFNNYLTDIRDVYVVETGVKSWSKTGTETALTNSSKNVLSLATAPFGWGMNAKIKTTNMLNTADAGVNIEPDEAGWSHIKAVVREDGRRGAYNTTVTVGGATEIAFIDVYDNTPGSEKYLGAGKANTWSVNKTAFNVAGFFLAANVDGTNHNVAVDYVRAKKERQMTVLDSDLAYTKDNRQVVFYMTDDINAATVDAITVTDASGVAVEGVEASVDAAMRAITVSFNEGLAAGTYNVDLSRVLGTNGVAVWNDEYVVEDGAYVQYTHAVVPFTVSGAEAGSYAAIASSTPAADAADVSVHVGTASVSYEVALDDETLDGITLVSVKDGAEAPIRGKVTKTLSDDGKTVTFTFGRLDAGLHRIKVDGTVLKDAAGEIVATETIEFTTTEPGYEINTDMSDISTDAETGALNDARFTYGEGAANYTIQTDGDNKYMQINPSQVYTSNASMYLQIPKAANFNNYLTDIRDVYVVETGVKSWSKTGTETALTNSSKTVLSLASAPFSWPMNANIRTTNMLNTADANVQVTPDEDGWSHIKAVVREDGRRGAYNTTVTVGGATEIAFIDVYDNTPGSEKYLGAGKANTWSVNKAAFNVAGFFLAANVDGTNHNVAVDYVRAKKERQMTVLDSDLAYTKADKKVVFYMTDDINAATVDAITVTDAQGTAVEGVEASVDAAMRAITVSFNEGLAAGTYNVDLSRVLGTNGVAVWNDEYVVEDGAYVQYTHAVVPFTVSSAQAGSYAKIVSSTPAAGATDVSVNIGEASVTYGVALNEDTLDGITLVSVVDGEEAAISGEVTKTLSDDGKTVNFTFGRLSAGLHRIKVDGAVLKTADGEIVTTENVEFTTVNTYASIASSTPAANAADVSVHVGEASVTYGFALNPDTLDGITLVSVNGETEAPIRGKVTKTLSDDGKTVTFTFGRLDAGLHRIKVDGTVLAAVGGEIVSTENIEFTTVDAEQTKLDFTEEEGFTVGGAIPTGKRIIAINNALSVVKDGETNQVLRLQAPNADASKHFGLIYDFTSTAAWNGSANGSAASGIGGHTLTDERDVFVIDTAIKSNVTVQPTNSAQTAFSLTPLAGQTDSLTLPANAGVKANGTHLKNASTDALTLTDGWAKARAVVREDGKWYYWAAAAYSDANLREPGTEQATAPSIAIDLYDATPGSMKYIDTTKGGSYSAQGIKIVNFFVAAGSTNATENYADVDYIYTKKEKAMTVMESDLSYTKADKKIVFYMTDDIDEASADRVVVKNGETVIEDREVTVNNADRSITVEFAGLTAGNYTVDISKVLGTNGVAVYNGLYQWDATTSTYANHENLATASFTVSDAEGSYAVTSVKSGETVLVDTIDADAGEITIEFAGDLAGGAADLITFTKEGEDRIAGKLIKTQDGATVTLNFGRLDAGAKYVLTIPNTVKSLGGAAVDTKTYTLTATRDYLINAQEQFSKIAADTKLHEGAVAWTAATGDKKDNDIRTGGADKGYSEALSNDNFRISLDGDVTMKTTEGGEKYLEMKPAENHTSNSVGAYIVPKTVNGSYTFTGRFLKANPGYVLAMDATLNTQAVDPEAKAAHNTSVFAIYHRDMAKFSGSAEMGRLTTYYGEKVGGINLSPAYQFNAVAANEYNTARTVMSTTEAAPADKTNSYKLYDLDNGAYVGENARPDLVTWTALARLAIQSVDTTGNVGSDNVMINLKDYKAFLAKPMSVLDTQFDSDDYVVTIAMTDAVDPKTADNLVITLDGEEVNSATYDVECNDDERTIEISFPYGLKAGVYNVSLADVEPRNGLSDGTAATSFTVESDAAVYMAGFGFTGSVDGGETLKLVSGEAGEGEISIGDADTITVTAEIGGADDAAVFLAIYDEDYNLVDVVKVNGDAGVYTATLENLPTNTVKHASMYIWRSLDTLAPLFKPLQCL